LNDLILPGEPMEVLRQTHFYFPNIVEALREARTLFERIQSFEDVETYLLRGAGLSPNTYRSYLTAVRQLYDYTGGLNPLQVTPGHIEAYYDDIAKHVDRNTAYLRIRGLKRFSRGLRKWYPVISALSMLWRIDSQRSSTRPRRETGPRKHSTKAKLGTSWPTCRDIRRSRVRITIQWSSCS